MKKILFLLLLPITCFAQGEISNFWEYGIRGISDVINNKFDSYMIFKDEIDKSALSPYRTVLDISSYRKFLYLNADGTFHSVGMREHGDNCFDFSQGTFQKIDEKHIRLQINVSTQSDLCPGGEKLDREPRDLGIFEIKTYEDRYDLIKINNK
nr:hypothetical protein [Snodgrassella alvi]